MEHTCANYEITQCDAGAQAVLSVADREASALQAGARGWRWDGVDLLVETQSGDSLRFPQVPVMGRNCIDEAGQLHLAVLDAQGTLVSASLLEPPLRTGRRLRA